MREFYLITPCGEHVVTRYRAVDEDDAWVLVGRHFCVIPAERPARIAEMKRQGFRVSLAPPPPPPPHCTCSPSTVVRGGWTGWETFDHEPTCQLADS